MATDDILTDDYVAGLLTKDAKESSIKYSEIGLDAFKQSKPPANKPKPNTRFLRNIIKDTDSHNAALLAKEAAESRSRLQGLISKEHRDERAWVGGSDIRKRQLGDIAAILGGRPPKRKRTDDLERSEASSKRRNHLGEEEGSKRNNTQKNGERASRDMKKSEDTEETRRDRHRSKEDKRAEDSGVHSRHRRRERSTSQDQDRDRDRHHARRHRSSSSRDRRRERDGHRRHRSRSRSPREHRTKESRHDHRSSKRERSKSPKADRERSHRPHRLSRSPQSQYRHRKASPTPAKREEPGNPSDSDPLDEIIGPRPASTPKVRSRGRGILSQGPGIEARFSASYDPTTDVQLDPDEEDDWDQALEALRDRQKWHQAGADRLRAAGFTDEEVAKWEKGGEKREEDVKWTKRGESREWDRGKVIDDDGVVSIDVNWGRLKDT